MKYDTRVINWLDAFGHFHNELKPEARDVAGAIEEKTKRLPTLNHKGVKQAVQSIQELDANYERLWEFHHGPKSEPAYDGIVDEVTSALLAQPRCECPDYVKGNAPEHIDFVNGELVYPTAHATGSGSWPVPGCDEKDPERDQVHSVRVFIDDTRATSHQKSILPWCKQAMQVCCANVGLRVRFVGSKSLAELATYFGSISGSTIGYHEVYPLGQNTCNIRMDGKIDTNYNANRDMFARLLIHEMLGHGIGHQHTRGGIMNPSIMMTPNDANGFPTWKDGASGNRGFERMVAWFGGEPVSITPNVPNPTPQPPAPQPPLSSRIIAEGVDEGRTYQIVRVEGTNTGSIVW